MKTTLRRRSGHGFTLIELMIVITIIALLAALTMGGFSYAQTFASRSRTQSYLTAIKVGLEKYKEKWGEYPEPASPDAQEDFSGVPLNTGGAAMLYQALSGDGNDAIKLNDGGVASDGTVTADKIANAVMADLPKAMILHLKDSYMLVDGFSRPFQYQKTPVGANAGDATNSMNPNYDLWSYGNATKDEMDNTLKGKSPSGPDPGEPTTWIKNW